VGSLFARSPSSFSRRARHGPRNRAASCPILVSELGVVLAGGITSVQETSGDVCEGGKVTITVTID
jgi:hypothetical protein